MNNDIYVAIRKLHPLTAICLRADCVSYRSWDRFSDANKRDDPLATMHFELGQGGKWPIWVDRYASYNGARWDRPELYRVSNEP